MKYYINSSNKAISYILTITINNESLKINCKDFLHALKLKNYLISNFKDDLQCIVYDSYNKTILYYSIY